MSQPKLSPLPTQHPIFPFIALIILILYLSVLAYSSLVSLTRLQPAKGQEPRLFCSGPYTPQPGAQY